MNFFSLFMIAVGLSMDAFAVSICKGLSLSSMKWTYPVLAGVYFGGFQALMPLLGYGLGARFQGVIARFDHWIAFVLLCIIGLDMLKEARQKEGCFQADPSFDVKTMVVLAVATSIDALAVGITFAFLQVQIAAAVLVIGVTTFCFSAAGVKIGHIFGAKYQARAELAGGAILIFMGFKILLEHLGVL